MTNEAKRTVDTGTDQLLCEIEAGVATITLNRPDKRNALSNELTPALRRVLLDADTDPAVRCVVITGAGRAFCSGGDVSGMGGNASPPPMASDAPKRTIDDAIRNLQQGQETLTLRLFDLSKPTIAALPGAAAGAGMSIALACDLRIAAQSAFITTAFANIGLSGDYGGSWLLTRLVGPSRAKELYYTSRRVGADEGLALGIFNEVVADDELMARTQTLAGSIASGPPIALRYMKENLNRAVGADLRSALAMEADRMVRCTRTDDHKEAVQAFMAKRKPTFRGQ
ncbi:MAG TPA: enoyl-CoA hydratase [Pseudomonadales bacterium]|nr:enoyl-CoA hydratase [Pseudomonadales bacterium]